MDPQSRLQKLGEIDLVKPLHSLKKSQLLNDLLVVLRQKIQDYPASHNLKGCSEFLLYCCRLVENIVLKKDNVNKKQLILDLFKSLFNLQPPELLILDSAVQFLWDNKLINKVPHSKKAVRWLKKKVSFLC
jgi:hypothetical protein